MYFWIPTPASINTARDGIVEDKRVNKPTASHKAQELYFQQRDGVCVNEQLDSAVRVSVFVSSIYYLHYFFSKNILNIKTKNNSIKPI